MTEKNRETARFNSLKAQQQKKEVWFCLKGEFGQDKELKYNCYFSSRENEWSTVPREEEAERVKQKFIRQELQSCAVSKSARDISSSQIIVVTFDQRGWKRKILPSRRLEILQPHAGTFPTPQTQMDYVWELAEGKDPRKKVSTDRAHSKYGKKFYVFFMELPHRSWASLKERQCQNFTLSLTFVDPGRERLEKDTGDRRGRLP